MIGVRFMLLIIFLLISFVPVQAKNSAVIRVSCSIPAVPGLNAPQEYDSTDYDHNPPEQTQVATGEEKEEFSVVQKEEAVADKNHLASLTSVYAR